MRAMASSFASGLDPTKSLRSLTSVSVRGPVEFPSARLPALGSLALVKPFHEAARLDVAREFIGDELFRRGAFRRRRGGRNLRQNRPDRIDRRNRQSQILARVVLIAVFQP